MPAHRFRRTRPAALLAPLVLAAAAAALVACGPSTTAAGHASAAPLARTAPTTTSAAPLPALAPPSPSTTATPHSTTATTHRTAGRTGAHSTTDPRAAREPSSPSDTSYRCTNRFDYSGDPRNNATINSIGSQTGHCPTPITAAYQDPHQSTNDPWVAGQLAWCRAGHDGVPPSEC